MTHRESKLDLKDLEILKNLPNLAEKINQNMQTVDNIMNAQRELNSSISSVNSSNNALRGLGQSKGKNRKLNLEEAIDIKNIVKQSIEGLNNIFDNDKKTENKNSTKNPLSSISNSNLGVLKENNILTLSHHNLNTGNQNNINVSLNINNYSTGKNNFPKNKNLTIGNNSKFEPIEEENNLANNDFTTNNIDINENKNNQNSVTTNINGNNNPSLLKSKRLKLAKDKKDAINTLNNINVLTSRISNNINNIQNNIVKKEEAIEKEKIIKNNFDDKNLNNPLNKSKNISKNTSNNNANNNNHINNNHNNNYNLNPNNNINNNNPQRKNTLNSTSSKNQTANIKKTNNTNISNVINITNNSNVTTDAGLTTSNFSNVLNSSRVNNKNLKSTKEKLTPVNNNINKPNNSNNSTNNNHTLNNNYLNESLSPYNVSDNIIEQLDINLFPNKKIQSNNLNKDVKNPYPNPKQKQNINVANSLNINKIKSKSKIKSTNKRYNNISENDKMSNDFYLNELNDEIITGTIRTESNNDYLGIGNKKIVKNQKIKNENMNNCIQNDILNVNLNTNDKATTRKLPRDSKSPNIRNYRTKRNMNSISLNDNGLGFIGVENLIENIGTDLKEAQHSYKKQETLKETQVNIYSTENNEKKYTKPKLYLKDIPNSVNNSNSIVTGQSKTPSNKINKGKLTPTAKNLNTVNSQNVNKNINKEFNFNNINDNQNPTAQINISCEKFPNSLNFSAKKRDSDIISDIAKDEKNIQKVKSTKKINNSNNGIKGNRNLDLEKEKNKLDKLNKEFLNNNNLNNKFDLNSIQIHSINLFNNTNNTNNFNFNNNSNKIDLIDNLKKLINQNNNLNANIKSKDIFEMMFLFSEFNRVISTDIPHKKEHEKVVKKISFMMKDNENIYNNGNDKIKIEERLEDKIIRNNSYFNDSFDCPYNNANLIKNKTSDGFFKNKTMNFSDNNENNTIPYFSTYGNNLKNDNNYEFNKTVGPMNSLAKARMEKDLLKNSKNFDMTLPTNYKNKLKTYRNSNPDNLNNFTQNLNELNHLRNNYNRQINDAEININPYLNNFNNNKMILSNSNNLNSSLIEDVPLENPFIKENAKFISNDNIIRLNLNNNPKEINTINKNQLNKSNNNNLFSINNIIKIQKYWRKWKLKKILSYRNSKDTRDEVKNILFNTLAKDEKLNNLINTIYNALNIFNSIRTNNSKSYEAINDYIILSQDNQSLINETLQKYHKEIINNHLKK